MGEALFVGLEGVKAFLLALDPVVVVVAALVVGVLLGDTLRRTAETSGPSGKGKLAKKIASSVEDILAASVTSAGAAESLAGLISVIGGGRGSAGSSSSAASSSSASASKAKGLLSFFSASALEDRENLTPARGFLPVAIGPLPPLAR